MGAIPSPDLDAPNMFAWRDPARIQGLLEDAGFTEIVIDQLDLVWHYDDLDAWWDTQLDISTTLASAVGALSPARRDDLRDAIDPRMAAYVQPDGSVLMPGRTHVAAATA